MSDFSPHHCVGFVFLILYPAPAPPPAPPHSSSASVFHTTLSHHHLSHTSLSHTIFHTQRCHTPPFTHLFVTHLLSHTSFTQMSHTSLSSHTICHTPLCHTPSFTHLLCRTPSFTYVFATLSDTSFCAAGVALGDIHLHFAWQAWHLATSASFCGGKPGTCCTGLGVAHLGLLGRAGRRGILRGKRGIWRYPRSFWRSRRGTDGTGLALVACQTHLSHTQLGHTPSLSHAHHLSYTSCHTPSFTRNFVTHTQLCQTQPCHIQLVQHVSG